jgi:hypothetical protein
MSTGKRHEHRVEATNAHSPNAKSVWTFKELFLREDSSTFARPAYDVDLQNEADWVSQHGPQAVFKGPDFHNFEEMSF